MYGDARDHLLGNWTEKTELVFGGSVSIVTIATGAISIHENTEHFAQKLPQPIRQKNIIMPS